MNRMNHEEELQIAFDDHEEDYKNVCNNLYNYNVSETNGLLKKPGKTINLFYGTRQVRQLVGSSVLHIVKHYILIIFG